MVVYADSPSLHLPAYLLGEDWRSFLGGLKSAAPPLRLRSYLSIITDCSLILGETVVPIWRGLDRWIRLKIDTVARMA